MKCLTATDPLKSGPHASMLCLLYRTTNEHRHDIWQPFYAKDIAIWQFIFMTNK